MNRMKGKKRQSVLGCMSNEATFVFSCTECESKKGSVKRQELYKLAMFRVLQLSEVLFWADKKPGLLFTDLLEWQA